ncbi:MAG TPA: FHA domain-containing protein, partial [Byssovorax sp.]
MMDATIAKSRKVDMRGGVLRVRGAGSVEQTYAVGSDPLTIGRHPASGIVLDDPLVSAVHADLMATPEGVRLRDCGSSNGTFLAGARVVEAYLLDRTELVVGETTLEFEPSAPTPMQVADVKGLGPLVGGSAVMQRVFSLIRRGAPTDLTVLLLGETGTGKELAARALHDASARRGGPFVVVDCGAIPPSLAEAHLFGHEAGSYTGASAARTS